MESQSKSTAKPQSDKPWFKCTPYQNILVIVITLQNLHATSKRGDGNMQGSPQAIRMALRISISLTINSCWRKLIENYRC